MKIHIVTIGSPKFTFAKQGLTEYIHRMKHYHRVRITHIADKHNDSAHLRAAIGSAYTVALVIDGPQLSSPQLATFLRQRELAAQEICFVIGGPDGLPQEIIANAHTTLGLSSLTFPHDLAMVVLAEALYRAATINANHPYHH